jgi:hypothetical protein
MKAGQKYSPFICLHTDSTYNLCGTVHKVASPEMLYCNSSTDEHFEKRARELRQSPNIVEGINSGATGNGSPAPAMPLPATGGTTTPASKRLAGGA